MNSYKIWWKKRFFWHSRKVVGHSFMEGQNRMYFFFEDGSIEEIPNWLSYRTWVGTDYVDVKKRKMEEQAGMSIPLNVAKQGR